MAASWLFCVEGERGGCERVVSRPLSAITSRVVTTYTICGCEIGRRRWKFNVFYHMVMVRVVMVRVRVS